MTRRISFLFSLGCLIALSAASSLAKAQDTPQTGPEAGHMLATKLQSLRPEENVKWSGTLQIFGRGHPIPPIPISCETVLTETNWSVTYQTGGTATSPAEKLTVIFFPGHPNQYIYAKAAAAGGPLGKPAVLTGAEADVRLADSDFRLSDLGFEFYHWPDQIRRKGDRQRGRPCYVLESVNPKATGREYSRVITWVDESSDQPLQAEAYGADDKKLKDFELGSITKVSGHYEVKNLKMFNLKTGSRTYLNFDLNGAK
jgi:hypothetical protein